MRVKQYIAVVLGGALLVSGAYGIERTVNSPANAGVGLNELGIAALVKALEGRVKVLSTELETVQNNLQTTQNELSNTQTVLQNTRTELQLAQAELSTTKLQLNTTQNNLQQTQQVVNNYNTCSSQGTQYNAAKGACDKISSDFMVYVQNGNWDPFFGQNNTAAFNCPPTYPGNAKFTFKFSIFAVTQPYLANQKEGGHTAYKNATYCVYGS